MTGKAVVSGGLLLRTQATGYGVVYLLKDVARYHEIDLTSRRCLISGSGNVAIYACEKAMEIGMKVIGMSDSKGYILDENLDLDIVRQIKGRGEGKP